MKVICGGFWQHQAFSGGIIPAMHDPREIRICLRHRPGGRVEISTYVPAIERENRTGFLVDAWRVDDEVAKLKRTLEAAGNWMSGVVTL